MMKEERLALWSLMLVEGLGHRLIKQLLAHFGSAVAVWQATPKQLKSVSGIGEKTIEQIKKAVYPHPRAQRAQQYLEQHPEIQWIDVRSSLYPVRLKRLLQAPVGFFLWGKPSVLQKPTIAVVGTRRMTPYGESSVKRFVEGLVKNHIHILSGLALGIDAVAHKSALAHGGVTSAVLAHGFQYLYPPQHKELAKQIIATRGALITPFFPDERPKAPNFPARNALIAALSDAVLIGEAYEQGGALITATYALRFERPVFAIPGRLNDPSYQGCLQWIAEKKAQLAYSPEQLLQQLQIPVSLFTEQTPSVSLNETEEKIVQIIQQHAPIHIEQLALLSEMPIEQLYLLLVELECKGVVKALPGNRYAVV